MEMNYHLTVPSSFNHTDISLVLCRLRVIPQIWWSPCPSRECPDEDEQVDFVLDRCVDHCMLSRPTESPAIDPADEKDDIGVHISHKIKPPNLSNSSKSSKYVF